MAANQTDEDLLACYQGGDIRAFERLYERYSAALMAYLVGLLGEHASAEDALQVVFAGVARQKLAPKSESLRGYLFTAARHAALNQLRSDRRLAQTRQVSAEILAQRKPGTQSPVALNELSERLNTALSKLPDAEREIVLLKCQGELTFEESAAVLGIPAGTAATRYRSALKKLREHLERV